MTLLEFSAAVGVATLAMIGGAVLSAAITSPAPCQRVLAWLDGWIRPLAASLSALLLIALLRRFYWHQTAELFADPLVWLACAEAVFLFLQHLAWRFTELSGAQHDHPEH